MPAIVAMALSPRYPGVPWKQEGKQTELPFVLVPIQGLQYNQFPFCVYSKSLSLIVKIWDRKAYLTFTESMRSTVLLAILKMDSK